MKKTGCVKKTVPPMEQAVKHGIECTIKGDGVEKITFMQLGLKWETPEDVEAHTLKVSAKAKRLSTRAGNHLIKQQEATEALMRELERCNPDKDLQDIQTDEFSWFTGENFI